MDTAYLKKVLIWIISALLLIGVIFYFGYHIRNTVTRDVETEPVEEILTERTLKCEGVIFRTEIPLSASSYGNVVPAVSDGTKMEAGGEVAGMYSGDVSGYTMKATEIDKKIKLLESVSNNGSVRLKSTAEIDASIDSTLSLIRKAADGGDLYSAAEQRNKLIGEISKRDILTGTGGSLSDEINALISEKAELRSSLGVCTESIIAPAGGYYYSDSDGYEKVFSPGLLEDITYGELDSLLKKSAEAPSSAGKIVTSSVWYYVCNVGLEYADVYTEGDICKLTMSASGLSFDMNVYRIMKSSDGVYLILKSDMVPVGESFSRNVSAELVTMSEECFRIPVTALRVIDGEKGVYVLDGPEVKFRRVSVLYKSENMYIVEIDPTAKMTEEEKEADRKKAPWLKLHDSLIVEGKGLYDGKTVG